ncbi:cytidine deaminase [Roseinatronobacter sp. S2]|uniref:cytidine deaminase n=1 Tax=Roseinatronobacter sp. S2 TaxID=3035471 RepID=UPI00240EE658|nr:cytidine deaminase [Roseinatronobacter sp. S2]WFE76211.1 cytidine deaminase [Roseinatronobacter sp. S2]
MTLLLEARRLREMAYAPYSGFQVGAALRSTDGRVFGGCNVENAAYPEGLCAEAGAIAAMVAGGAREIAEIVVVADSPTPVPPCGGCRQKIAEFASADTQVTMVTLSGQELTMTLAELLPGAFGPRHMDKG